MNAHQDTLASPDIRRVAKALGLEVRQAGGRTVCKCPLAEHEHDDLRPACVLGGNEPGAWYCHKCGEGGDAAGAFAWLRERGFLAARGDRSVAAEPGPDGPLHEFALRRDWAVEALEALGAVAQQQNGRPAELRFPMRDSDGEVTGWRRRRADNQPFGEAGKFLTRRGEKNGLICPWPLPDAEHDPVLVVEGEADAVAALSALVGIPVVATPGADSPMRPRPPRTSACGIPTARPSSGSSQPASSRAGIKRPSNRKATYTARTAGSRNGRMPRLRAKGFSRAS